MKIGEKYLYGFSSQSCGFTGEVEFEGEVIDICEGVAIVKSDYFDRFWVDSREDFYVEGICYAGGKIGMERKPCHDIRTIRKLEK